jgi:flagellar motor switch protein FliN/FliY
MTAMPVPTPDQRPPDDAVAAAMAGAMAAATAAATAAAAMLPAATALTPGPPGRDPKAIALPGQAACARFAGTVQGEVVAIVAQGLVDALRGSAFGALDAAQAVQPALEAAAATFGPVVVDPATLLDPAVALSSLAAKGDAIYVPLNDEHGMQAAIALVITGRSAAPPASFPAAGALPGGPAAGSVAGAVAPGRPAGLDLLHHLEMEVSAELGRTRMTVRELLSLSPGAIVELDRAAGSPADLLVNGRLVACGEVVVIDENFGLRITSIIVPGERG